MILQQAICKTVSNYLRIDETWRILQFAFTFCEYFTYISVPFIWLEQQHDIRCKSSIRKWSLSSGHWSRWIRSHCLFILVCWDVADFFVFEVQLLMLFDIVRLTLSSNMPLLIAGGLMWQTLRLAPANNGRKRTCLSWAVLFDTFCQNNPRKQFLSHLLPIVPPCNSLSLF